MPSLIEQVANPAQGPPSKENIPMSCIFHRTFSKQYPTASAGRGVYLLTKDGRKVLDGSSGAAVSCLGHGHEVVIEAIIEQTRRLAFAHTSFFTNDPSEELASLLLSASDGAFSKVMFLSSGLWDGCLLFLRYLTDLPRL